MEKSLRRHGSVTLVDDEGNVSLDLGVDDGIGVGTQMAVMRGFYLKDTDTVIMRNIGTLEVRASQVRLATAQSISGQLPRIGDRVYPLYTPPNQMRTYNQGREVTQTLQVLAGAALLLGIVATALGNQSGGPPTDVTAAEYQQMPGVAPVDRVFIHRGLNPDPEATHDWLLYRGTDSGFPAMVDVNNYLIAMVSGGAINYIDDDTSTTFGLTETDSFLYIDNTGTQDTGTVTATYNHFGLVAGDTYYYRLRRVVNPYMPDVPISSQVTAPVTPVLTVTPTQALSDQSQAAGPITFTLPPVVLHPLLTDPPQPQQGATFEWTPSLGADTYQVFVYSDPLLTQLVVSSPPIIWTGQSTLSYTFSTFTLPANSAGTTTLYWVVGGRTSLEANPQCMVGTQTVPYVLSAKTAFQTVQLPPSPASAGVSHGSSQPSTIRDFWGTHRMHP
jgi:hypothetical protein